MQQACAPPSPRELQGFAAGCSRIGPEVNRIGSLNRLPSRPTYSFPTTGNRARRLPRSRYPPEIAERIHRQADGPDPQSNVRRRDDEHRHGRTRVRRSLHVNRNDWRIKLRLHVQQILLRRRRQPRDRRCFRHRCSAERIVQCVIVRVGRDDLILVFRAGRSLGRRSGRDRWHVIGGQHVHFLYNGKPQNRPDDR